MPPKLPPHIEVKSAKAIIKDGVVLWLKECAKCGAEFYVAATSCSCHKTGFLAYDVGSIYLVLVPLLFAFRNCS
jgi:hypothetical protein